MTKEELRKIAEEVASVAFIFADALIADLGKEVPNETAVILHFCKPPDG